MMLTASAMIHSMNPRKICSAHAGGYLPSYSGRSDALCGRGGGADCKALKKKPSEYFRRELLVDTMIFR